MSRVSKINKVGGSERYWEVSKNWRVRGFSRLVIPDNTCQYRGLPGDTVQYPVLPGTTEYYRVLPGIIRYLVFLSLYQHHSVSIGRDYVMDHSFRTGMLKHG